MIPTLVTMYGDSGRLDLPSFMGTGFPSFAGEKKTEVSALPVPAVPGARYSYGQFNPSAYRSRARLQAAGLTPRYFVNEPKLTDVELLGILPLLGLLAPLATSAIGWVANKITGSTNSAQKAAADNSAAAAAAQQAQQQAFQNEMLKMQQSAAIAQAQQRNQMIMLGGAAVVGIVAVSMLTRSKT